MIYWIVANVFAHILPPSAGDDHNPVNEKQCKEYIYNTQLIFLARSLVNLTNSNIMPIS